MFEFVYILVPARVTNISKHLSLVVDSAFNLKPNIQNYLEKRQKPRGKFAKTFFLENICAPVSLVLGLGLEHSCPWPREGLSSEGLSLVLALASDFFVSLALASSLVSSTPPLLLIASQPAETTILLMLLTMILTIHSTVFQKEVLAIPEVTKYLLLEKTHNQSIVVLVDSQAAIKLLIKCTVASITVLNRFRNLHQLCKQNHVSIAWIPGHRGTW